MKAQRASLDTIRDFLAQKRIAMVGVSRDSKDFSRMLFAEFCRRGYDMVAVNPNSAEILGRRCFARIQDVQPRVNGVLIMTAPALTETVVKDCAEAGIPRVWMYRAAGDGAVSPAAVQFCEEHGIQVIPGECPFMVWPKAGFHRLHTLIRQMTGQYPRRAQVTPTRVA